MPVFSLPPEVVVWASNETLSWWDEQKVKNILPDFPGLFGNAVADWAKFKQGVKAGLFTASQRREALDWFQSFPRLWETVRPNYMTDDRAYAQSVDRFVSSMKAHSAYKDFGLGIAPALIAGVLIVGGAAAALWAVQYMQKQANISKMIDGVLAGKISPDILGKAIEAEESGGLFGGVSDMVKWILLAGVAAVIVPRIWKQQ